MPGTLYVVATPIGNLEDITLRALRVLREVDLIAAEDTRRTARLLQHYSITTPTTSLHEHNERHRAAELLQKLASGEDVALVSDAGTPLVSDPGARLVRLVRAKGFRVIPVPGASAIMTALAALGLPSDQFLFLGFPPTRSNARKEWLNELVRASTTPVVLFEAPHRVCQFLTDALDVLGDRPIWVARELTKLHEELVEKPISRHLAEMGSPRGEFTLVIPSSSGVSRDQLPAPSPSQLRLEVGELTNNAGCSTRQAVAAVAKRYGLSTNQVYQLTAVSED